MAGDSLRCGDQRFWSLHSCLALPDGFTCLAIVTRFHHPRSDTVVMVVAALAFITGCRSSSHIETSNSYVGSSEKKYCIAYHHSGDLSRNRLISKLLFRVFPLPIFYQPSRHF